MSPSHVSSAAEHAKKALAELVNNVVSSAALSHYAHIVELIRCHLWIDINVLFSYIALLVVICWVGQWLHEIINFIFVKLPKFIKNLFCGKINLCLLNSSKSRSKSSDSSCSSDSSSSSSCSSSSLSFLN